MYRNCLIVSVLVAGITCSFLKRRVMPKGLTRGDLQLCKSVRIIIGMVSGFKSEWCPASSRNARPVSIGICRRRGYRVSATAKSYLRGLRTTVMSVYEVTGVSTATFAVRDIIRDGAETTITRTAHIRDIRKKDRIATRIVPVRGGHVLANGTMPFPGQMDEMLMAILQEASGGGVGQRPPTITEMLRVSAHVFSIVFLLNGLDGRLDRNWQDRLHKSPFTPPVNALRRDPVGALFI